VGTVGWQCGKEHGAVRFARRWALDKLAASFLLPFSALLLALLVLSVAFSNEGLVRRLELVVLSPNDAGGSGLRW